MSRVLTLREAVLVLLALFAIFIRSIKLHLSSIQVKESLTCNEALKEALNSGRVHLLVVASMLLPFASNLHRFGFADAAEEFLISSLLLPAVLWFLIALDGIKRNLLAMLIAGAAVLWVREHNRLGTECYIALGVVFLTVYEFGDALTRLSSRPAQAPTISADGDLVRAPSLGEVNRGLTEPQPSGSAKPGASTTEAHLARDISSVRSIMLLALFAALGLVLPVSILAAVQESHGMLPPPAMEIRHDPIGGLIEVGHSHVSFMKLYQNQRGQPPSPHYATCGRQYQGLTLVDYGLLSSLAYFDPRDVPAALELLFPPGQTPAISFQVKACIGFLYDCGGSLMDEATLAEKPLGARYKVERAFLRNWPRKSEVPVGEVQLVEALEEQATHGDAPERSSGDYALWKQWAALRGKARGESQRLFVQGVAALRQKHGDGGGMGRVIATKNPTSGGMGYSFYSPELDLHVVAIRGTGAMRFDDVLEDLKLWVESVVVAIMCTLQPLTLGLWPRNSRSRLISLYNSMTAAFGIPPGGYVIPIPLASPCH